VWNSANARWLNLEAEITSKSPATIYQLARGHIPEDFRFSSKKL